MLVASFDYATGAPRWTRNASMVLALPARRRMLVWRSP
jgi:hypothetical protein